MHDFLPILFEPIVSYGLFCLGGALGWRTWRGTRRLRRVAYLLISVALAAVFTFGIGWIGSSEALGDRLATRVLGTTIWIMAYGYLTAIAAVARSRDAVDDVSFAPLAFVPVLNLVLFLDGSHDAEPAHPSLWIMLFVGEYPILPLLLLALTVAGFMMFQAVEKALADRHGSVLEHPEVVRTIGPEIWARRAATELRRDLPERIDDVTELVGVSASDEVLTYEYRVAGPPQAPRSGPEVPAEALCHPTRFRTPLENGVRVVQRIALPDGVALRSVETTFADC